MQLIDFYMWFFDVFQKALIIRTIVKMTIINDWTDIMSMDDNLVKKGEWKQKPHFLRPPSGSFQRKLFWEGGRRSIYYFSTCGRKTQLQKGDRFFVAGKILRHLKNSEEFLSSFWPEATAIIRNSQFKAHLKGRGGVRGQQAGTRIYHLPSGHQALSHIYCSS